MQGFGAYGNEITSTTHIGNVNPFRWKSFYFDAETGLYYANGRYYDPETGLYLNAAPMESIADKAFVPKGIDRNAPLCNNILELAGNPFTVETTVELTADGTYDVLDDLSGPDRLQYKVQLSIEKFFNWLNKQSFWRNSFLAKAIRWLKSNKKWIKLAIGIGLLVATIAAAILTQGTSLAILGVPLSKILVGASVGGLIGASFGYISAGISSGNKFDYDAATDGFLFGAIAGVASGALGAALGNLGRPIALYESHTKCAVYQGVLNSCISGELAIIECAVNGNVSAENIAVAMALGLANGILGTRAKSAVIAMLIELFVSVIQSLLGIFL